MSVAAVSVFAKSTSYTYDNGSATMTITSNKVSARMYSDYSANLLIWGQYKYRYINDSGNLDITTNWTSVSNCTKYGTDTGASGWTASLPSDGVAMYSLQNRFLQNSNLVIDIKTLVL